MISKNKNIIEKSFESLSDSISEPDRIMIETRLIMYRFLSEIDKIATSRRISRKELADRTGTSASYVTQLFQGKKIINLQMLARMKKALDIDYKIEIIDTQPTGKTDCNKLIHVKAKVPKSNAIHRSGDLTYAKSTAAKRFEGNM